MAKIITRAPGKLYLAGEYAVLDGCPAIVVALDRFVTVTITPSTTGGTIRSNGSYDNVVHWTRVGYEMVLDYRDDPLQYTLGAIRVAESYLFDKGIKPRYYNLTVTNGLASKYGDKYGLGSSAAVTVATIKALFAFNGCALTKDLLFKLAAISHMRVQKNGSGGDIAACVYTGYIAYTAFDKDWLQEEVNDKKICAVAEESWPKLNVVPLTAPDDMDLLIGWTGIPASTPKLVDENAKAKEAKEARYDQFLSGSRNVVEGIIEGFKEKSLAKIKACINANRKLLLDLSAFTGIEIEIPLLKSLIEIADKYGAAAKSSGAGNGDCGIAIAANTIDIPQVYKEWEEAGIKPMSLKVYRK